MKRAAAHLDPDSEIRLRLETLRGQDSLESVRKKIREDLSRTPSPGLPPGAGAFDSGHSDTAERAEEILRETGFGESRCWIIGIEIRQTLSAESMPARP
jgi:hypothetical protein